MNRYITPEDMEILHQRIINAVDSLADEALQRRSWLGTGPEESSPTEFICQLVNDTDFKEYLDRNDTGLVANQIAAGKKLVAAIESHKERHTLKPEQQINDPRWLNIRLTAKDFLDTLNVSPSI